MTRQRLRPAWSAGDLARIYATPHDHRRWADHHLRVDATISLGRWICDGAKSGADLSCGNGSILGALPLATKHFGDFAPGYDLCGPLEETIGKIPRVDLFVCSESLEHLDDPDAALAAIRPKAKVLLLSTPVDCWDDDNPEHYWAWSREDVERMLADAGFSPFVFMAVDFRQLGLPYCFGIWGAR